MVLLHYNMMNGYCFSLSDRKLFTQPSFFIHHSFFSKMSKSIFIFVTNMYVFHHRKRSNPANWTQNLTSVPLQINSTFAPLFKYIFYRRYRPLSNFVFLLSFTGDLKLSSVISSIYLKNNFMKCIQMNASCLHRYFQR